MKEIERFDIQANQTSKQLANQVLIKSKEARNNSKQMRLKCQDFNSKYVAFKTFLSQIKENLTNYNKSEV